LAAEVEEAAMGGVPTIGKNLKKANRLYLIDNAPIDPVWLWQDGYHATHATFRSALDRMHEDPYYERN
jgi:hypothetical protein